MTLDFETSQLLLVTSTNDPTREVPRLSNHCVGGYANLPLRELVPGCGSRPMSENEPCAAEGCNNYALIGSDRCIDHLESLGRECLKKKQYRDYESLRTAWKHAAAKKWEYPDY